MKIAIKILAVLFSAIIALTFCSCEGKDGIGHISSSPVATEDNKQIRVLLNTVTASDDLDNIKSITILDETCIALSTLTDKTDMEFLKNYTYSHYRTDKRENWDGWLKNNSVLCLNVDTKNCGVSSLFLMQDGSIAISQMCGDSEVSETSYDFYTADKENTLTKEKFESF